MDEGWVPPKWLLENLLQYKDVFTLAKSLSYSENKNEHIRNLSEQFIKVYWAYDLAIDIYKEEVQKFINLDPNDPLSHFHVWSEYENDKSLKSKND